MGDLVGDAGPQLGKLQTLENMPPGGHRWLLCWLGLIFMPNICYSTTKPTSTKLKASQAAEFLGYGAESYGIIGTIRAGRLKRIAQVLHQSEHSEAGQRTPKSDWASELVFVTQGRGERIPVRMICDLYAEDASSKRRYAFELVAPAPDRYALKAVREGLLKLYSMDQPQVDEAYAVLPYESTASRQYESVWRTFI